MGHKDSRLCRLRFPGCRRHATQTMPSQPEFLGGQAAGTIAVCNPCAKQQQQQRNRAAGLFGHSD
jgi:hypothetical protein